MNDEKYDYGFIYKLESPSGKIYIGQTQEYIKRKNKYEKNGIKVRWHKHINSSKRNDKNGCVLLNNAIRKYGEENFKVSCLIRTRLKNLDLFEEFYIKMNNSLVPNGYNLQTGGTYTKHSEETRKKRSNSMKKMLENSEKRKIWSDAKKGIIQKNKRKCKKKENEDLPKYIYYRESKCGKYKGYYVEHPLGNKSFRKSKLGLEQNLKNALNYIKELSS